METEFKEKTKPEKIGKTLTNAKKTSLREFLMDMLIAIASGAIVGTAYYFFQNSNGFAPGGVGGLATITYYLLGYKVSWAILMFLFNLPIFILVAVMINKKLGISLILYLLVQSLITEFYAWIGAAPYCFAVNGDDFEIIFACLAAGIVSGFGFSLMLKRLGVSGGTYAISALIKKFRPETNIAYIAFIMDSSVVVIAYFVYGMKVTPVLCTMINLFVANVVVDFVLSGIQNGYKFEIVTDHPSELASEIMRELGHGVTEIHVQGMYTHTERYMLVCIVNKKQIGQMMRLIKKYEGTFSCFQKVNDIFGNFKR